MLFLLVFHSRYATQSRFIARVVKQKQRPNRRTPRLPQERNTFCSIFVHTQSLTLNASPDDTTVEPDYTEPRYFELLSIPSRQIISLKIPCESIEARFVYIELPSSIIFDIPNGTPCPWKRGFAWTFSSLLL